MVVLVIISNLVTQGVMNSETKWMKWLRHDPDESVAGTLYLLEEAARFVRDPEAFSTDVNFVSQRLDINPAWLMAVMYAESGFDAAVENKRGSGAVGLIQFMPSTARELGVSAEVIRSMDHSRQLDFVYRYLDQVRRRHGQFRSLTDLYLGILYPKAMGQDPCYVLYSQGSVSYAQNAGLDENKDGRVTVSDIERRMYRKFPEAYLLDTP